MAGDAAASLGASFQNLRGTQVNYLQTVLSFAISLVSTVYGVYTATLTGEGLYEKAFIYLSLVFMVNALTVAGKSVRDGQLADLFQQEFWSAAVRGSLMGRIQAIAAALASVVMPFYTIIGNSKDGSEWSGELGFVVLGMSYLVSSTLNLSKAVRDRTDADFFEDKFPKPTNPEGTINLKRTIDQITAGTVAFILLNGLSLVAAFAATVAGVWQYPGLVIERKGIVTIGVFFMAYAAFQVAKLARDLQDPELSKHQSVGYNVATALGFLLSLGLLFGSLFIMPLTDAQRKFCVTGSLYVLSSTLAFSKLVRDGAERRKAREHQE